MVHCIRATHHPLGVTAQRVIILQPSTLLPKEDSLGEAHCTRAVAVAVWQHRSLSQRGAALSALFINLWIRTSCHLYRLPNNIVRWAHHKWQKNKAEL